MTTERPDTRISTDRTRSPTTCCTCFSIRFLAAASAAGSERGSTVIELRGPVGSSRVPVGPRSRPNMVEELRGGAGRDAAGAEDSIGGRTELARGATGDGKRSAGSRSDPSPAGGSSGIDSKVSGIGDRPVDAGSRPAGGCSSMGGNNDAREVDGAVGAVVSIAPVPAPGGGRFGRVPGRDSTGAVTPGITSNGRFSAGAAGAGLVVRLEAGLESEPAADADLGAARRESAPLREDPGPEASAVVPDPDPAPGQCRRRVQTVRLPRCPWSSPPSCSVPSALSMNPDSSGFIGLTIELRRLFFPLMIRFVDIKSGCYGISGPAHLATWQGARIASPIGKLVSSRS